MVEPTDWLLKWEVTNFADHIYHTNQLSIIRGGSELAEEAAQGVAQQAVKEANVSKVYVAAAQGLFRVKGKNRDAMVEFAGRLEQHALKNFDITSATGFAPTPARPGAAALKRAIWGCEHQIEVKRCQTLNVHPGATKPASSDASLDNFDHVRLADALLRRPETNEPDAPISAFNHRRYNKGRGVQKRLENFTDRMKPDWKFALEHLSKLDADFESLARNGAHGNLIGVVQADGIGFTKNRQEAETADELSAYSAAISAFVDDVLFDAIRPDLEAMLGWKGMALPVHLLLSAGDEFVIVCRSERALSIAESIHAAASTKTVQLPGGKQKKFSFSVGVVVGHATTPIRLLKKAAGELEHSAKRWAKSPGRSGGATDFAVFKSVGVSDHGIDALRENLFTIPLADGQRLPLFQRPYAPGDLIEFRHRAEILARSVSRGQLHTLLRDLPAELRAASRLTIDAVSERYQKALANFANLDSESRDFLQSLGSNLGQADAPPPANPCLPLADLDELLEVGQ